MLHCSMTMVLDQIERFTAEYQRQRTNDSARIRQGVDIGARDARNLKAKQAGGILLAIYICPHEV